MLVFYPKGVARENLGEGAEYPEFEKQGGVLQGAKWQKRGLGRSPTDFFILMLFYVFLHHFLSMFLIFNNFDQVLLSFSEGGR